MYRMYLILGAWNPFTKIGSKFTMTEKHYHRERRGHRIEDEFK